MAFLLIWPKFDKCTSGEMQCYNFQISASRNSSNLFLGLLQTRHSWRNAVGLRVQFLHRVLWVVRGCDVMCGVPLRAGASYTRSLWRRSPQWPCLHLCSTTMPGAAQVDTWAAALPDVYRDFKIFINLNTFWSKLSFKFRHYK